MQATKALGKCIPIFTVLMLISACNQPSSQNPNTTDTPLAATAFATPIDQTPSIALSDVANFSTSTAPAAAGTSIIESTETEPPIALTAVPGPLSLEHELAEIGKRQRETLSASTAFGAPPEMQLHDRQTIQLLLNFQLPEEALAEEVTEPGLVSTGRVEITPRMKAEVILPDGEAFTIVPITEPEQLVGDTESTEWRWYVTANKAGSQTLTVVLSRGVKYDNKVQWIEVDAYERTINVKGTLLDRLKPAGWKWIAGVLLVVLAGIAASRRWAGPRQLEALRRQRIGHTRDAMREGPLSTLPGHSGKDRPGNGDLGHIFISYRRSDSADIAGRIYDRLVDEFGRSPIFKDVDSIPLGTDFKDYLDRKVSECNVLLAVIGDRWMEASDANGKRRLDDPADFVRVEIESALERGIPVIPLLVRNAQMPHEEGLPPSLRKLVYKNGIPIRPDPDFHRDMDRLISALDEFVR